MFATADIKSGYIKNIGGQVSQRGMLIVSRAVALALFTAITFAGIFVFQAAKRICLRLNMWCGVTGGDYTLFLNGTYASLCICVNMYGDSSYN